MVGLAGAAALGSRGKGAAYQGHITFSEIVKVQFQKSNILKGPMKLFTMRPFLDCNLSWANLAVGDWP